MLTRLPLLLVAAAALVHTADLPPIPPLVTAASPRVLASDLQAPTFDISGDPVVQKMLTTWNTRDRFGMACTECHGSPNAFEFALVGIDPADINRRGVFHHSQEMVDDLKNGVQRLREVYGIVTARNRHKVFLLQPGPIDAESGTGQPLEGTHYWDRDARFVREEMLRVTPTMAVNIDSLDDVKRVMDEFLATEDRRSFRAPFRSSMYSGDRFHPSERGEKTGTLNKWISLFPIQPRSAAWAAEIAARRAAYLDKPSNINFYNWYRAEDLGAGAFGSYTTDEGQYYIAPDDATFKVDHWTMGFEKRKRQAAMIAFHQMLQEALGMDNTLLDKGHYALEIPGQQPHFSHLWATFNPFHGLGDDTGRPSAVRSVRLSYPASLSKRLVDGFLDFQSKDGEQGVDAFITRQAAIEANNWWLLSLSYDGARRAPTMGIGYWALHMQTEYGLTEQTQREKTPREQTVAGYPGFSAWAFLRGQILDLFHTERYGTSTTGYFSYGMDTIDGLLNPYGWADEAHRQALITLALNTTKIRMASLPLALERAATQGRTLKQSNFTVRMQNHIVFARELARQHANPAQQLASLNHFYDLWCVAADKLYAGTTTPPARVAGTGDGLVATYFDKPDFTLPLRTEIVRSLWYSSQAVQGQASTRTGTVFTTNTAGDHVKGFTGTDGHTNASPIPAGAHPGYSVQWTGYIQAPTTGDYAIVLWNKQGRDMTSAIIVNGERLAEGQISDGRHCGELDAGGLNAYMGVLDVKRIRLEAGKRYPLTIHLTNPVSNAFWAHLVWQAPEVRWAQIVPEQYLYTSATSTATPVTGSDQQPYIGYSTLPDAYQGVPYAATITCFPGNAPVRLQKTSGTLPPGLLCTDGLLSGTPTQAHSPGNSSLNTFTFGLTATDADGDVHSRAFTIRIGPASNAPEVIAAARDLELDNGPGHVWRLAGSALPAQPGAVSRFPGRPAQDREILEPLTQENPPGSNQ
jgi:hypothetical protein